MIPASNKPPAPIPKDGVFGSTSGARTASPTTSKMKPKYPGVKIGSRGTKLNGKDFPVGSYYGYETGIVGLRLFPNPDFDEKAAERWDPETILHRSHLL